MKDLSKHQKEDYSLWNQKRILSKRNQPATYLHAEVFQAAVNEILFIPSDFQLDSEYQTLWARLQTTGETGCLSVDSRPSWLTSCCSRFLLTPQSALLPEQFTHMLAQRRLKMIQLKKAQCIAECGTHFLCFPITPTYCSFFFYFAHAYNYQYQCLSYLLIFLWK